MADDGPQHQHPPDDHIAGIMGPDENARQSDQQRRGKDAGSRFFSPIRGKGYRGFVSRKFKAGQIFMRKKMIKAQNYSSSRGAGAGQIRL
jgi:hypothetical protein